MSVYHSDFYGDEFGSALHLVNNGRAIELIEETSPELATKLKEAKEEVDIATDAFDRAMKTPGIPNSEFDEALRRFDAAKESIQSLRDLAYLKNLDIIE